MSLTPAQQQALAARGNVLMVAGAGTGKTRTLVERCLNCLLEERPRTSLEEILMVTFTEAAAAEMRQRIRARLEEERARQPRDPRWPEQLALFETAHIGTLHSFCLQLVRQHFYELELDPQLTVLADEEARLLAEETLDGLFQKHYAGRGDDAEAVRQLIQTHGRGWDKPIRSLVLRIHHYTQTLPEPESWLRGQAAIFAASRPAAWEPWLLRALAEWRARWLPALQQRAAAGNDLAANCAKLLLQLQPQPGRREAAAALDAVSAAARDVPAGAKTDSVRPLRSFLDETAFLASLGVSDGAADPLLEDWSWVREPMGTLLKLSTEFTTAFGDAKRELGMVDFHDLEQHALRILWDARAQRPTKIAQAWRARLRFVFVDEYQDINAAQDKIIEALSREGAQANRFLVGDVKQSIYRFRLANPRIFQTYVEQWNGDRGRAIPLADNFRSREGLLDFVNSVFGSLMRRELGGVEYDEFARLRFGAAGERSALSTAANPAPAAELHLRVKRAGESANGDPETVEALAEVAELEEADKEARLVALRLRELKSSSHPVWDEALGQFRPADWRDMAILLRAPANKAESYAKEFSRLGVPLQVARGGFYQNLEVSDLLNLLQVLDNPLQDIPVLAVLHSPLVGLDLNELAAIRIAAPKTRFWTALVRWHEVNGPPAANHLPPPGFDKVAAFLARFARWRRLARQASLSRCLEAVLAETHYADWLLTQTRGEQRRGNVRRLLGLAERFDQFQRQGLYRFLRFIEAQQLAETEPEVAAVAEENAVRLMSIHQSKGLEFPIVVVADLGKSFNLADLRAELILDEEYGLCPQIKPPQTGARYPSLPFWLARQRQKKELLGEELRLLYVAMTRARDSLVLSASISKSKFDKLWRTPGALSTEALLAAGSYADWLGLWCSQQPGGPGSGASQGETAGLRWTMHVETELGAARDDDAQGNGSEGLQLVARPETWQQLEQRLGWRYPFASATRQPAKTSVSALRRRAAAADEELATALQPPTTVHEPRVLDQSHSSHTPSRNAGARRSKSKVSRPLAAASAVEVGNAHHAFLERVTIGRTGSLAKLKAEAQRLQEENALRAEEAVLLDFEGLAAFWSSDLGARVRAHDPVVQRELPFTARFSPAELAGVTGTSADEGLAGEFVVVQGVADLVVLLPQAIWLVDFKTDEVELTELPERARLYEPQLTLYARALARIYRRPITECWLYFLTARQARPVPVNSP